MSDASTFAAMRWRIIRHGPHDERGFGLVAGGAAALGVVVLAVLVQRGILEAGWLGVVLSGVGLTWLLGPILLPGSSSILDPQWFRTLPRPPLRLARAMAPSEALSVGTVITAIALSGLVVRALGHGAVVVLVAVGAAVAQLFLMLWLGRCATAVVARLLRSPAGMWWAAGQMSVMLALCFAGWVPVMAWLLPDLAEGGTDLTTPSAPGGPPAALEQALAALPTGWGSAAVEAAISGAPAAAVAAPLLGLVLGGLLLAEIWIRLTAQALRRPPAREQSGSAARGAAARTEEILARRETPQRSRHRGPGAVRATSARELKTWFRDPQRRLEMGHAWLTPLLMILLVAPTSWHWGLPFIGVMAAVLAAMVAVNTLALDGTALWQLLTTPGAVRADVMGRGLAWLLLFGLPVLSGTLVLSAISGSPLAAPAVGMTLAALGCACGVAPLLGALMPAPGADARDRVSAAGRVGNPAGGQYTAFTVVAATAAGSLLIVQLTGLGAWWPAHLLVGAVVGLVGATTLTRLTIRRVEATGPALLATFESGDVSRLRGAR